MVYKYKIYVDSNLLNPETYFYTNQFITDDNHTLKVTIKRTEIITTVNLSVLNKDSDLIANIDISFSNKSIDKFKVCKTFLLRSVSNFDKFIVKIFTDDILALLQDTYSGQEINNEILFTNYKNSFELIDLCALVLTCNRTDYVNNIFINKLLYYGYQSIKELTEKSTIDNLVDAILTIKPKNIETVLNLFVQMSIIDIYNEYNYTDLFYEKIKLGYKEIYKERLNNLKTYFVLQ